MNFTPRAKPIGCNFFTSHVYFSPLHAAHIIARYSSAQQNLVYPWSCFCCYPGKWWRSTLDKDLLLLLAYIHVHLCII